MQNRNVILIFLSSFLNLLIALPLNLQERGLNKAELYYFRLFIEPCIGRDCKNFQTTLSILLTETSRIISAILGHVPPPPNDTSNRFFLLSESNCETWQLLPRFASMSIENAVVEHFDINNFHMLLFVLFLAV